MDKRTAEKKERLLAALDAGMTMIHLDARRPGVLVPEHLRTEPQLLLNLSYRFAPHDLSVGDWGVRSTLTFSGQSFCVAVPWSALYAILNRSSKEFWLYPDDMPTELVERLQVTSKVSADAVPESVADEKGEAVETEPQAARPSEPADDKPIRRGHLRLVK